MPTIVTILTQIYADWECAPTMAVARTYYGFDVMTATPDGKPVTSAGGLKVTPDMAIKDIKPDALDVLLINGGQTWEGDNAPDIGALLTKTHESGKTIGAICAATRALAETGLLNAHPHTSNNLEFLQTIKGYNGSAHYVETAKAINSNRLITAAGTSPMSFMQKIMECLGKGGPELDFYLNLHAAQHAPTT